MNSRHLRFISTLALILVFFNSWALENISILLRTNIANARAIGFKVDGIEHGSVGKTYRGTGPKNKLYFFGYREDSVFGRNIDCGSLLLSDNSAIILERESDKCIAIVG